MSLINPNEVEAWFLGVVDQLPVATFQHDEAEGDAIGRRADEPGRACCRCGEPAVAAFLHRGDVSRWVDACAACGDWIRKEGGK